MASEQLQWIKGDYQGTVENVGEQKGEWTYFQSGHRIKTELINEFMIPINHSEQIVQIPGVTVQTPSYSFDSGEDDGMIVDTGTGEMINTKHVRRQTKNNLPGQDGKKVDKINPSTTPEVKVEHVKHESPITLLITKANKDKVPVNYEFEIEIPKADVYSIIDSSFDVDLNQEIIDVVLSSIDIKTLKASVEEAINNTIKSYYKSK